ncbi:MAG: hypothetical protein ABH871_02260 [Pseudomonadota bacterium]
MMAAILMLAFATYAYGQPKQLPGFILPDPDGTKHASSTLVKNGMVLVVTAPTLHDKGAQEGWDKYLVDTMPKSGPILIFIEDMSVSAWKNIAQKDMKKDWKPGVPPLLLLDEAGSVRKSLGVGRDATAVLVYDKSGTLVYTDKESPSLASAKTIWSKLQ